MKAFRWMMVICMAVVLMAGSALAQTGTSRINGQLFDPSGALVAGAQVTATHEATNVSYTARTTDAGTYVIESVPPGMYTIRVEISGFKTFVSKSNVLTIGVPLTVNATLEIGETTTVVEVSGSYERVQTTTSGNKGTTVDARTLRDLPLGLDLGTGGRNPLNFVSLQPGVASGANTGGGVHVNGARDRAFNFTLDGIDINETSAGGSNFSPLRTNPDSLSEFRVVTSNATAQYGRNSGAQVELVTRSGTNEIHGSAFYWHRNNGFGANEWESNILGLIRPRLIQHQWGTSIGGPLIKDRTFWFFNFQQQRQIRPFTVTRTVYTQAARQGTWRYVVGGPNRNAGQTNPSVDANGNPLLPACGGTVTTGCINTYNIAGSDPRLAAGLANSGLDPAMIADWIGLTALPNDFSTGDGLNTAGFVFSGGRLDPQRDFVGRVDHKFNEKHSIFGRWAWGKQDTVNDTGNSGQPRFPGLPAIVNTIREPNNLALGYRQVLSPTMVNEIVVGTNHFLFDFVTPTAGEVLPFFTTQVTDPLLVSRGNLRKVTTYQIVDNLSWIRGAHSIKAGINLRYQQHIDNRGAVGSVNSEMEVVFGNQTTNLGCLSGASGVNASGQEFFCAPSNINSSDQGRLRNMINDLLGRVSRIQQGFVATDDFTAYQPGGTLLQNDARYGEYDFYIQNTWKWKSNFTWDFGLRLELKGHPTNPRNRIRVPDQEMVAGAAPSNTVRWVPGPLYGNDYNNWSPSIGFSWDPFRSGKTAIRANYRLAYDRINTFLISSAIFNNLPGVTFSSVNTSFGVNGGPNGTAGRWRDALPSLAPTTTPDVLTQPAPFGTASITVFDPNFRAPKTSMWSLDIQREFWKGTVVEVSYIGRKGVGLIGGYNVNQVDYRSNGFLQEFITLMNNFPCGGTGQPVCPSTPLINALYLPAASGSNPERGANFVRSQFQSTILNGSVAGLASDAANRTVANTVSTNCPPAPQVCSLLQAGGFDPFFFKPYPQFATVNVIDSNDWSTYHGLQVVVTRKFTSGLQFQGSYTWSKSLDTRSFDPAFTVVSTGSAQSASSSPFDIFNRGLNYAPSDFDRRHLFSGYLIYDLPFGPGQRWGTGDNAAFSRLIEGWTITTNWTISTGRPFTAFSGFSQYSNVVNSTANCITPSGDRCPSSMGQVLLTGEYLEAGTPRDGGVPTYFSAAERAMFSQPGPGELGNTGRNFFTGPGSFNMDAALLKTTRLTERFKLELRLEAFNLTNTPTFGFPTTTIPSNTLSGPGTGSSTFGRIRTSVLSFSRKVRIGAKLHF